MRDFFNRSTQCLEEGDSAFAPQAGMMTVAQQVAHVAQTIDWFITGTFTDKGFDMDFTAAAERTRNVTSLAEARRQLDAAFDRAKTLAGSQTPDQLHEPVPPNPLFKDMAKIAMLSYIDEHTAHHRGALTVYSRLLGKNPKMPYMD
jgi:uncharacterized damage-inducible protein DinB